jgi:hypothetical protein
VGGDGVAELHVPGDIVGGQRHRGSVLGAHDEPTVLRVSGAGEGGAVGDEPGRARAGSGAPGSRCGAPTATAACG